jgi:carbonic anhydrase
MKNYVSALLVVFVAQLVSGCLYQRSEEETHWHYGQGNAGVTPYFWWKVDEHCGQGSIDDFQSPIDISNSQYSSQMKNLKVSYPILLSGVATNNGHTVNFVADDGSSFKLSKGPLGNDVYELIGFHFHWGEFEAGSDSLGSEHSIAGRKTAAEIHFVHGNTKYNSTDITNHSDGIAVIGVLLEVDARAENSYDEVFAIASQLPLPESEGVAFDINLGQLLPQSLEYYHYDGSLTTPTCNSAVQWIVLRESISITPNQLEVLFGLHYDEEATNQEETMEVSVGPNNRPLQPINGRTIYRNFYFDEEIVSSNELSSDACAVVFSAFVMVSMLFLHFL